MPKLKPPFKVNVPMILTWCRIAMIPLVIGVFYLPGDWGVKHWMNVVACVLFCVASITDALDGFLARRYQGWATRMGAFLDPVADKLLVATALVALVSLNRLNALIAVVIIGREITVSALREWMAKVGESGRVKVNWFGKIKTIAQMTAIPCLLWWDPLQVKTALFEGAINVRFIGEVLIMIAALLTIYSMAVYMYASRKAFDDPIVDDEPGEAHESASAASTEKEA